MDRFKDHGLPGGGHPPERAAAGRPSSGVPGNWWPAGGSGALLREASGSYMLSAASRQAAAELVEALPACTSMMVCQADLADIPAKRYGLEIGKSCHQAVYTGGPLPQRDVLTFRAPGEAELDIIEATYALETGRC